MYISTFCADVFAFISYSVKLLFSTSTAFAKFELTLSLSSNYPSASLPFTVEKKIGNIGWVEQKEPPLMTYISKLGQEIKCSTSFQTHVTLSFPDMRKFLLFSLKYLLVTTISEEWWAWFIKICSRTPDDYLVLHAGPKKSEDIL